MKTLLVVSCGLCSLAVSSLLYAQNPTPTQIKIAQTNHNKHCPKDLPSALFDAKKLKNYQIKWQVQKGLISSAQHGANSDQSALAHLVESANTAQNLSFKITQSGCEFVNEQLEINLPLSLVEKNGTFCNECLIQQLKSLKPYFLEDRGGLLMNSIETLNHYLQGQKIRIKHEYIDPEGGEMAHSITVDQMQKIPAQKIWRIQLTASIGPL